MQNVNRKFKIWGALLFLLLFAVGVSMYFTAASVQAATKTGFVTINGDSYYINEDGSKQKGWLELEGKKYYFNTKTGVQIKGWVTDSKGRKRYFSKQAGIMMTGWVTDSKDQKRYFDPSTVTVEWLPARRSLQTVRKIPGILQVHVICLPVGQRIPAMNTDILKLKTELWQKVSRHWMERNTTLIQAAARWL